MDAGDPLRAIDEWVDDVVANSPLLVLVDDLHWADGRLRDLVSYLIAGPADRRLAILVTVCAAGQPDGDPVHAWLADTLRTPTVTRLPITALTRSATETQLADLIGGRPHQSLVDDIYTSTGGNPYFTALLSQGLRPSDRRLPYEHPGDLVAAVMGRWHSCTAGTRALLCLMAVAGEAQPADALQEIVTDLGWRTDVGASLAEAQAAGLLGAARDGPRWFLHPMQAAIIERTVPSQERWSWLTALARVSDRVVERTVVSMRSAIAQSRRHDRAGSSGVAYAWAMRAWTLRGNDLASPDLRAAMRRAADLHAGVPGAAESPRDLWQRVRDLAAEAGADAEELEAVEALIGLADEIRDPLPLSELLVRRMLLRAVLAIEFYSLEAMEQAVALASVDPSSWQMALAQAELAHVATWREDRRAAKLAAVALARARSAGHPMALSMALTAAAMVELESDQPEQARLLVTESIAAAVAARSWWAYVHAVMWESNALPERHGHDDVEQLRRRRTELLAIGGPMSYALQIGAVEADTSLELGDWQTCQHLLRESLVCDPGPIADLRIRVCLARLSAYQGRADEALAHVDRARELCAARGTFANTNLDVTWATALLEAGRTEEAFTVAARAVEASGHAVDLAERLLPLAARALADLAVAARDKGDDAAAPLASLASLRRRHPTVLEETCTSGRFVGREAHCDAVVVRRRSCSGASRRR